MLKIKTNKILFLQVWLFLADNYIKEIKIDWEKTVKFAFNEKSNPDDNKLGLQIVKVSDFLVALTIIDFLGH